MNIVIKPNKSFNIAIDKAFKKANVDTSLSYSFMNIGMVLLLKDGKPIKVISSKIKISYEEDKWVIKEF